ncbi:dihydroorotate oxidase [Geodermatophilus sabuli]|uniref:Dihydroorotate dehydrogenase n=1 Tax=Geodermatophilus sabuli TaxID=1564158 RepID=A0A285E859_9ACTN|nr:dihydroorotate oxidase [Geodermatophilus sabuli]MBB3081923.1 dihydroorotate dehydrogenase [Geodermatophilus sabuli]SNX95205.1 Dihydroorotate dehydrogenase [Geodermatophilus sabuli]
MTAVAPAEAVRRVRDDLVARGLLDGLPEAFLAGVTRFARPPQPELDALATAARGLAARLASGGAGDDDLPLLARVLFFAGGAEVLAAHGLRTPAYDVLGSYRDNLARPLGPRLPRRPVAGGRRWRVLGRSVGFPIGVPACVLNGGEHWVRHFAGNGYSVLTYKTVRSRAAEPNPQPNWAFARRERASLRPGAAAEVTADPWDWVEPGSPDVSTVNSFGVPSLAPEEWQPDLERSLAAVADDQLLLVSVMGEDADGAGLTALADDFARVARMAEEAGAPVVELNLSCPNTLDRTASGVRPPLCLDADATVAVVERVRRALDDRTGLVAKLSWLDEPRLTALVPRIASLVDGVAGINTLQSRVRRSDGAATFPGRELAGLSGIAVRDPALDFTRRLVALRDAGSSRFDVLAMGGVTDPASFEALFAAGADAVQSASGAFADPYLARDCIAALGQTLPRGVAAP